MDRSKMVLLFALTIIPTAARAITFGGGGTGGSGSGCTVVHPAAATDGVSYVVSNVNLMTGNLLISTPLGFSVENAKTGGFNWAPCGNNVTYGNSPSISITPAGYLLTVRAPYQTYSFDLNGNPIVVGSTTFRKLVASSSGYWLYFQGSDNGHFWQFNASGTLVYDVSHSMWNGAQMVANKYTTYVYDANGRLVSVQDSRGNATTLAYTSSGCTVTVPDGRAFNLTLDASGNLTQISTASAASALASFSYQSAGVPNSYSVYPDTSSYSISYNCDGSVSQISNTSSSKVFSYTSSTQVGVSVSGTSSSYNLVGSGPNTSISSVPTSGGSIQFWYDSRYLPTATTYNYGANILGNMSTGAYSKTTTNYNDPVSGLPVCVYKGGTLVEAYGYNSLGQMTASWQITSGSGKITLSSSNCLEIFVT